VKKNLVLCLVLVLALGVSAVSAQKTASSGPALTAAPGAPDAGSIADGTPDSMVTVNVGGTNSWDEIGDSSNEIITQAIGAGAIVTGLGWNVTITTVGASWLSEVAADFNGIISLTYGVGDDAPGTATYSSGGIVDLTDNAVPNIPADAAGNVVIEFFESFDDVPDAIDATFDSGSLDVAFIAGAPVPTLPIAAMLVLVVMLLALSAWFLRRRTSET
jgi:hypothetical protein